MSWCLRNSNTIQWTHLWLTTIFSMLRKTLIGLFLGYKHFCIILYLAVVSHQEFLILSHRNTISLKVLMRQTHSSIVILEGISDQRRAYLTGVTCSWGSRSTCMCNIRRQKDARKSKGRSSSDIQRRIKSTSSWPEILLMARYWRSRHIRAKRFSWHLWGSIIQIENYLELCLSRFKLSSFLNVSFCLCGVIVFSS